LRFTGRVCLVWLLAGLAPVLHAEDAKTAAAPASARGATPATQPSATAAKTQASKPAPAPSADDEFLEFLGSIDTDEADEEWMDYLARTDIAKVAKAKKRAPAATEAEATEKAGK
jgi:hypothetical protein